MTSELKRGLLQKLEEEVGEHYFECLNFCSLLNMLREEIKFSDEVEEQLDAVFKMIKTEANRELD